MRTIEKQTVRWPKQRRGIERSFGIDGLSALLQNCDENDGGVLSAEQVLLRTAEEEEDMSEATVMLGAIERGDPNAAEQLLVLVYDELRRLAASKLAHEAPGQTLQATALVHEAWMRLVGGQNPSFNDRTHFFRASAEAIRRILIDRARRKKAQRHGGEFERIDFNLGDFEFATPGADDQLLAINEALEKFTVEHPVQADLVKLRYFGGLTNEEIAQVLGVSLSTVKNYWAFSRAWLLNEMEAK